jgi:hypothetical protein
MAPLPFLETTLASKRARPLGATHAPAARAAFCFFSRDGRMFGRRISQGFAFVRCPSFRATRGGGGGGPAACVYTAHAPKHTRASQQQNTALAFCPCHAPFSSSPPKPSSLLLSTRLSTPPSKTFVHTTNVCHILPSSLLPAKCNAAAKDRGERGTTPSHQHPSLLLLVRRQFLASSIIFPALFLWVFLAQQNKKECTSLFSVEYGHSTHTPRPRAIATLGMRLRSSCLTRVVPRPLANGPTSL